MIRIIYRWQVAPRNFKQFRQAWRDTTNNIHESVPGARGSFMLKSPADESAVVTIAKWDSLESWQKFWGDADPVEMKGLSALGKRISVEVFEEVEDHTR